MAQIEKIVADALAETRQTVNQAKKKLSLSHIKPKTIGDYLQGIVAMIVLVGRRLANNKSSTDKKLDEILNQARKLVLDQTNLVSKTKDEYIEECKTYTKNFQEIRKSLRSQEDELIGEKRDLHKEFLNQMTDIVKDVKDSLRQHAARYDDDSKLKESVVEHIGFFQNSLKEVGNLVQKVMLATFQPFDSMVKTLDVIAKQYIKIAGSLEEQDAVLKQVGSRNAEQFKILKSLKDFVENANQNYSDAVTLNKDTSEKMDRVLQHREFDLSIIQGLANKLQLQLDKSDQREQQYISDQSEHGRSNQLEEVKAAISTLTNQHKDQLRSQEKQNTVRQNNLDTQLMSREASLNKRDDQLQLISNEHTQQVSTQAQQLTKHSNDQTDELKDHSQQQITQLKTAQTNQLDQLQKHGQKIVDLIDGDNKIQKTEREVFVQKIEEVKGQTALIKESLQQKDQAELERRKQKNQNIQSKNTNKNLLKVLKEEASKNKEKVMADIITSLKEAKDVVTKLFIEDNSQNM